MKAVHARQQEELADPALVPAEACRPFDLNRTGMVLGEGSGVIILEELGMAQARGTKIYGEVIGFGSSSVPIGARRRIATWPLANAMRAALSDAGVKLEEIGHIQAHGLSTRSCDAEEAAAIESVFGPLAKKLPVTAAKSYFGNLGAGSGAVELIAGVLAIENRKLFPILNYSTPDPKCPVAAVSASDMPAGDCFLNLNVTPQGQAACILVRRFA